MLQMFTGLIYCAVVPDEPMSIALKHLTQHISLLLIVTMTILVEWCVIYCILCQNYFKVSIFINHNLPSENFVVVPAQTLFSASQNAGLYLNDFLHD